MAVFQPASGKALKMVSQVRTGLAYSWMPWTSGSAPLNMDAKHTGVTLGITTRVGTRTGASASTAASFSGKRSQRWMPTASGAKRSSFSTFWPARALAAAAMTAAMGSSAHWAGRRTPQRSQTVGVKAVTQRKSSGFSGKFMTVVLVR